MVGSFRGQAVSLVLADKGAAGVLGRAGSRVGWDGEGRDKATADLGLRPLIVNLYRYKPINLAEKACSA